MTNEISKISKINIIIENLNTNIRQWSFKILICCFNELDHTRQLSDNTSIFYHDAQLDVNFITLEPLFAGNK